MALIASTIFMRRSIAQFADYMRARCTRSGNHHLALLRQMCRGSYAGFWVTRRSGGVVCRHLDDLDATRELVPKDAISRRAHPPYGPVCEVPPKRFK
jgi:hypothetical protein